jgi:hypothetical protein
MHPAAETSTAPQVRVPQRVRRALVLLNEKAGSVGPKAGAELVEALNAAGVEQFAIVDATRMSRRHFQRATQFDAIIVLGGDGTARAAAQLAPRDGPPLILLPGGTLNILPKALYGDLAWPQAIAAVLERGIERRLPVGRANGEAFYVAGFFGAPTLLARARESVREGKLMQAIGRFRHFLRRSFSRRLRARAGKDKMRKAEGIGVLCPSFSAALKRIILNGFALTPNIFSILRASPCARSPRIGATTARSRSTNAKPAISMRRASFPRRSTESHAPSFRTFA